MRIIPCKIKKVASSLYGLPEYDIPKKHVAQMFRLLEHKGEGMGKMEARTIKFMRAVMGYPKEAIPPSVLATGLKNYGLAHFIKFIMPSYPDVEETVPEKVPGEWEPEGGWQDTGDDDTKTVKYDTGKLRQQQAMSDFGTIFKYASWFDGVRGYQETKGIPFSQMNVKDKEKALEILNADIARELKKNEYASEEEYEEAVNSAYRAIVYMLLKQDGDQKTTRMEIDPPATKKPEYIEPEMPDEDTARIDLGIPDGVPVAMPVKKRFPKEYTGPPARKKPASKPLHFMGSNWLDKIAIENKEFVGETAFHSGREVRIMSYFYDHAGMGDFMIVRYMDNGLVDRVPASDIKMGRK